MRGTILATALILAGGLGPALAQSAANGKNCPPTTSSDMTGEAAKRGGSGGLERPEAQPVERSAIVPNVGGHDQSAAPTVQQNGQDVVADANCPKAPNLPTASQPN
jgi:hypothetical protein